MRFGFFGVLLAFFSLQSVASAKETCTDKPVTEVVRFRLVAEATVSEFKLSAVSVEKELQKIPGYQRRSLLQSDTGEWLDIVTWDQLATAKAAAVSLQENSVAQAFFRHIDPDSVALDYYCE